MIRRRLLTVLLALGALGAAPASSAVASDATLKREISSNLVKNRPSLTAFQNAVDAFEGRSTAARLERATNRLRSRIGAYKRGVARNNSSSRNGLIAKRTLLRGLRTFDRGLREYKSAVNRVQAGSSMRSVSSRLRRANSRFLLAAKREESAISRLNITRPN
jgi:hypothetical protein